MLSESFSTVLISRYFIITENFVKNLREIKNELVGKLVKKHIQKGENNGQSNRYGKRHSGIKIEV